MESTEDVKPAANWPQKGRIVFNDVSMKYFENEAPVLKNLNFVIEDKEKIGIVGRSGAGLLIRLKFCCIKNDFIRIKRY